MAVRIFSHFSLFRFRTEWWSAAAEERSAFWEEALPALDVASGSREFYQVFPSRAEADLLVWSAAPFEDGTEVGARLREAGEALRPWRRHADAIATLWGLTRPSPYTRGESSRTIDPLAGERAPCLVVYPFTKTSEWHRLPLEERRRIMGEHIGVGRRYEEVDQLLLYSYGLQDQEFVVVYETADLARFSELVGELRATEARPFTLRDTPIWTALHVPRERATATW